MPCFYGVFPVQNSNLQFERMPVFVNKSFRDIFTFIKHNSWRDDPISPTTKSPITLVDGPPGSGKSTAAFAALRYLSAHHKKTILYLPLKSAGLDCQYLFAMLVEDWVIRVTLPLGINNHAHLNDVICRLRPEGIFLDGFCKGMESFVSHLLYVCQAPEDAFTTFFGATTSMTLSTYCFENVRKFSSSSWSLQDYINGVHAGMCLNKLRLKNLGLKENASTDSITVALTKKFNLAGGSCRFMLDYDDEKIINVLNDAIDRLKGNVDQPERSQHIVNTLFVSVGDNLLPVSFAAGIMMALSKKFNARTNQLSVNILDALQNKHKAMLGWLFEQEVTDRLKASLRTATTISAGLGASTYDVSSTICSTAPADIKDSDPSISELLTKMSINPVVNLESPVPFQLVRYDSSTELDISVTGVIKVFDSWQHLVQLVAHHNWKEGSIWLLPHNYANPFFDLAVANRETRKQSINMITFQITISTAHSCKARVMQLISTGLCKLGVKLNSVVHHAVLPSQKVAERFEFKSCECMSGTGMVTRAATVKQNKTKRKRSQYIYEDFNDDDEDDPEDDDLNNQTEWTFVDVQIGPHLVLTNSMCSER